MKEDYLDSASRSRAFWNFIPHLMEVMKETRCRYQAAALTYMTLFAIVPTMTVVFTMFSMFPAFDGLFERLQNLMLQYLLPDSGLDIQGYLADFTTQARSLTLAGVVMLLVTAYLMLKNIEKTFNSIWGVKEMRRGLSNFLLYWAILSLGPLLIGVGLAISTYLLSMRVFAEDFESFGIIPTLLTYFPWLLTTMAFTLLFVAVPNCKVPFKNALIGGVLTAICFELFKDLFGWIVAHSSFKAVYGAFAIVPLFLMWIYILWMIVLTGAVFVRSLSTFKLAPETANYPDLIAALLALWKFTQCQRNGYAANDEELLSIGIGSEQWQRVRAALISHHLIIETLEGEYVLCRNLAGVTLRDLADMVGVNSLMPGVSNYLQTFNWFPSVASRLLSVDQHLELEFDVPISELFFGESGDAYPDEGEGLELLQQELDAYGDEDAELPGASDLGGVSDAKLQSLPGAADLLEEDNPFIDAGQNNDDPDALLRPDTPFDLPNSFTESTLDDIAEIENPEIESPAGDSREADSLAGFDALDVARTLVESNVVSPGSNPAPSDFMDVDEDPPSANSKPTHSKDDDLKRENASDIAMAVGAMKQKEESEASENIDEVRQKSHGS